MSDNYLDNMCALTFDDVGELDFLYVEFYKIRIVLKYGINNK